MCTITSTKGLQSTSQLVNNTAHPDSSVKQIFSIYFGPTSQGTVDAENYTYQYNVGVNSGAYKLLQGSPLIDC